MISTVSRDSFSGHGEKVGADVGLTVGGGVVGLNVGPAHPSTTVLVSRIGSPIGSSPRSLASSFNLAATAAGLRDESADRMDAAMPATSVKHKDK